MKIKKWEVALIFGFIIAVVACLQGGLKANAISEKLIRLHVIANSDNQYDQELKLKVRDEIIPIISEITKKSENISEARESILSNFETIKAEAEEVIAKNGYDYSVNISLERAYYPSKDYDNFALPAGEYDGLKIIIGEGAGQNWWCVLFPPLCIPVAEETMIETATKNGLSKDDIAFITEDGYCYKIKFKTAEIYGKIKEWFKSF